MSYTGYGADSMPYYQFDTAGDGARSFTDASRQAILSMLGTMYVAPQVPAVDSDGTRVLLTPGGALGLPSGYASAVGAARAGQIVLALESFVPTIQQALRFTTADRVADLTADGGQGYAVLLTPETAQSLSPFEAPPTMPTLPAPPPPAPSPLPGSTPSADTPHPLPGPAPAPGAITPAPTPTAKAGLFGLTQTQTLIAGGAVLGVLALTMMASKKQPAKAGRYKGNRRVSSYMATVYPRLSDATLRHYIRSKLTGAKIRAAMRRELASRKSFHKNMTKKDYILAAASIAKLPKVRRRQMAEDLAKMFQADNPRFDRQRFFAACGV